jgi:hypothetical protein
MGGKAQFCNEQTHRGRPLGSSMLKLRNLLIWVVSTCNGAEQGLALRERIKFSLPFGMKLNSLKRHNVTTRQFPFLLNLGNSFSSKQRYLRHRSMAAGHKTRPKLSSMCRGLLIYLEGQEQHEVGSEALAENRKLPSHTSFVSVTRLPVSLAFHHFPCGLWNSSSISQLPASVLQSTPHLPLRQG